jgi:hypothetical protein
MPRTRPLFDTTGLSGVNGLDPQGRLNKHLEEDNSGPSNERAGGKLGGR